MGKLPLWFHKNHLSQYLKILFSLLYNASLGNTGVLKRHLVLPVPRSEDEMVGWYHRLDGHEFENSSGRWWWTGHLYCSPWGHKESKMAEQLNWYQDPTLAIWAFRDISPKYLYVHDQEIMTASVCFHRRKTFLYFLFHKERNKRNILWIFPASIFTFMWANERAN